MKHKKPILIAALIVSFSFTATAQQSVTVSGNNATGTGGSASYSVGQVIYTANSDANGNLTQGVQQPFEITTLGTDNHPEMSLQFSAYPNPASDNLTLSITNLSTSTLSYLLCDVNGRVVKTKIITDSNTNIDMNNLQAAIYFVKVSDKDKEIKTFKIIKK